MAGDSAPIYFAATYWLAKETPPTNKARNIFFGERFKFGVSKEK